MSPRNELDLTEEEDTIYGLLSETPPLSIKDISKKAKISEKKVEKIRLKLLKKLQQLSKDNPDDQEIQKKIALFLNEVGNTELE